MNLQYLAKCLTYSYFGESVLWLGKILVNEICFAKFSPVRTLRCMVFMIMFTI